ncbi:MAG: adenosylcobinamide-GDP ribazoletransferase [Wujia sp.]
MFKSLIIAFSTYSKIPMPRVDWNEKSMRYSMCFFPFIGVFIGTLEVALLYGLTELGYSTVCISVILTVLPVLVTGGIHMDGFMDTIDARSSYKDREEKLKILKDPHTGAFAIIFGIAYCLLYFGFMFELVSRLQLSEKSWYEYSSILILALGHVYSRALSGLSVVSLKKAKKDGMVAKTANASDGAVKGIMAIWVIILIVAFILIDLQRGIGAAAAGMIAFWYYRYTSYKHFGGITGDLAGYFLQLCALLILIVCAVHL